MAGGDSAAPGTRGRSPYRPEIVGLAVLGLSLAGSSAASWWGVGVALVSTTIAVTVSLMVLNSVRRRPAARWDSSRWVTLSITVPTGALVGAFVFAGSLSVLAVSPFLSLACSIAAERCGARRETVTAAVCVSTITAACVVFGAGDVGVGFSALVQGSVIAGAFVTLLLAARSVAARAPDAAAQRAAVERIISRGCPQDQLGPRVLVDDAAPPVAPCDTCGRSTSAP